MRSIIAIIAGCAFIIIVILVMQLIYIFIAVAYNALAKDYPFLHEISGSFRYLVGIPVFVAVMFAGGYITATIAGVKDNIINNIKVWPHSLAVGFITAGGMLYSAVENSSLTTTGIVVFILALVATTAGGLYWQSNKKIKAG